VVAAVTGVLLAAGAGRRAGGPKALRRDDDQTSWLIRSVAVLRAGGCAEVVVVLGCEAATARRLLEGVPVVAVENPSWSEGMSSSLRVGLSAVGTRPDQAALVHLVDLPDVGAEVVARVLALPCTPDVLARATYGGRPGHPVLIGSAHLQPLVGTLRGDEGAQEYLRAMGAREVECGDLCTGRDDDRPPRLAG
jgi:CTP:molybdopterin cytidylyltransferase MocA